MIAFKKPYVTCIEGPTPNTSSRSGALIDAVTLHYTVGKSAKGSVLWGQDPKAGGCAHFYVDRDGTVFQPVPLSLRAWHHGESSFEYAGKPITVKTDRSSIGIEIANCGPVVKEGELYFFDVDLQKTDRNYIFVKSPRSIQYPAKYQSPVQATHKFVNGVEIDSLWEPFTDAAIRSTTQLTIDLCKEFHIPLPRIIGHEDVATPIGLRKFDPGPLWPWRSFMGAVISGTTTTVPDNLWRLHRVVIS